MRRIVFGFLAVVALAASPLITLFPVAAHGPAKDTTITVGQRMAYVHVPADLDPAKKYPLVIGYHGGGSTAQGYMHQSKLFSKAEQAGFIAVCPEGMILRLPGNRLPPGEHRIWNSGPEYARATRADDVGFTRALIDKLAEQYPVDANRVYATGFSNGAQMCYRLATELADKIAAIAPMSGATLDAEARPSRPVSIIHFHGTADGYFPLGGGLGPYSLQRTPHVPVQKVISDWCQFNKAQLKATVTQEDGCEIQLHEGPAPVELVLVSGMGHQIAGGNQATRLTRQVFRDRPDSVAKALQFFTDHPMR